MKLFLFSFFILFFSLRVFSQPCVVAFATNTGSAIVRRFDLKEKINWVKLIGLYNPQLDFQLKREGYSREEFQKMVDVNNQAVEFLHNFYRGNIYGENSFFVGRLDSFPSRASVAPLIGRIIRKVSLRKAIVEVVTASGDLKKVEVEIESAFKFDYYNEGSKDIFGDGFNVFMKNGDFNVFIKQGSPKLEMVFAALKSNKKKLDSSLLRIPKRTNEEQRLKMQGFSSAYVRGIDEVNEWIAVVRQIRKLKVNPYKTHIGYFADKVKAHIDYIREGLTSSDFLALRALDRLKRHAELTIQKEGVTYDWWLRFNYVLSRIYNLTEEADVIQEMYSLTKVNISNIVNRFPAYIIMPTTIGKMGVMAINRANMADIYIGGLINKPEGGHGRERPVSPGWFFNHDISTHAANSINVRSTYFNRNYGNIYRYLVEKIQQLPVEKKKNAELALFTLMHEGDGGTFIHEPPFMIRSSIHETLESQILFNFNFKGLMDTPPHELQKIHEKVRVISDDFMRILEEVRGQILDI